MNTTGIEKHGSKITVLLQDTLAYILDIFCLVVWHSSLHFFDWNLGLYFGSHFIRHLWLVQFNIPKRDQNCSLTRYNYLVIFLHNTLISRHISSYLETLPRCANDDFQLRLLYVINELATILTTILKYCSNLQMFITMCIWIVNPDDDVWYNLS